MKLIVNADDFGLSSAVNEAIGRAFEMEIIDRATAMANAPFFVPACSLAHAMGIEDRIGVHFNIGEGRAITSEIANTPLFCSNGGIFVYKRNARRVLSRREMDAISQECEGQIRRFREEGLHPTHFDSHHHVHTEWFIFRAVEPVLRRHAFSSVRISYNIGHSSLVHRAYKAAFNAYLKRRGWNVSEFCGDYSNFAKFNAFSSLEDSIAEVVVHPTVSSLGLLIDAISGEELAPQLKDLKSEYQCSNQSC